VIDNQIIAMAVFTVPTMVTVLLGILNNNARLGDMNVRLGEFRAHMDARFNDVERRFNDVERRFTGVDSQFAGMERRLMEMDKKMDQRFTDAKDMWRSELHRVEEVLDARLKHLEER
jgi:hypothetical protein